MNEYIILNGCGPEESRALVKVSDLNYWQSQPNATLEGFKNPTIIIFNNGGNSIYAKESPAEIEALIMGKDISVAPKRIADPYLNDNLSCDSIDPIDYLKDQVNKAVNEISKLEEENAKLKDELYSLTFATIRTGIFSDLDWRQLSERLQHSNPTNPCCRETFAKLNGYYNGANINYFCASLDELDKRGELEVWRQAFKDKIQENKND